jgi:hypothetical protein
VEIFACTWRTLLLQTDVQRYVEEHPFGQAPNHREEPKLEVVRADESKDGRLPWHLTVFCPGARAFRSHGWTGGFSC